MTHYRRNFWCFAADYFFFGVGLTFFGTSTVLPGFLQTLGASSAIIGLASSLQSASWLLPQLFVARQMADKALKKPHVLLPAAISRSLIVVLAAALWLTGGQPSWAIVILTLLVIVGFWGGDGMASVPWFDMMSKVIPPNRRGRLSAIGQASSGIMGLATGAVVEWMLSDQGPLFPTNYAALFVLGFAMLALSWFSTASIVEEGTPPESRVPRWREFLPDLWRVLKTDHAYRRYILCRQLYGLSALSTPFYMTYALSQLNLPARVAGRYTSIGVVGSILSAVALGWVNERYGGKRVIQISILLITSVPVLALAIPALITEPAWLAWAYGLVFFVFNAAMGSMMTGWMPYVLELAPDNKRATYVGLTNTLNGVTTAFATIGGLILQWTDDNYRLLFTITLLGLLLAWPLPSRLPEPRHAAPTS
jgi:MFS family permease